MKIRCSGCGHNLELSEVYNDYEGEVKCWICGTVLDIRIKEGMLKYLKQSTASHPVSEEV